MPRLEQPEFSPFETLDYDPEAIAREVAEDKEKKEKKNIGDISQKIDDIFFCCQNINIEELDMPADAKADLSFIKENINRLKLSLENPRIEENDILDLEHRLGNFELDFPLIAKIDKLSPESKEVVISEIKKFKKELEELEKLII